MKSSLPKDLSAYLWREHLDGPGVRWLPWADGWTMDFERLPKGTQVWIPDRPGGEFEVNVRVRFAAAKDQLHAIVGTHSAMCLARRLCVAARHNTTIAAEVPALMETAAPGLATIATLDDGVTSARIGDLRIDFTFSASYNCLEVFIGTAPPEGRYFSGSSDPSEGGDSLRGALVSSLRYALMDGNFANTMSDAALDVLRGMLARLGEVAP